MSENMEGAKQKGVIWEIERAGDMVAQLQGLLKSEGAEKELAGRAMEALSRALTLLRVSQWAPGANVVGPKIEEADSHQLLHPSPYSPSHSVGSEESSQYCRRRKTTERRAGHRRRSHPYSQGEVALPTLDDGYTWRKYGQKDIQNSKCPRSYYRCTHKFSRGCLATRQAQKREDDPNVYYVTYFGQHTCNLPSNMQQQQQQQQHPAPRSGIINFSPEAMPPSSPESSAKLLASFPVLKEETITSDSVKDTIGKSEPNTGNCCHSQQDVVVNSSPPAAWSADFSSSVGVEQGDSSSGENSCMSSVSNRGFDYMDDPFYDLSTFFSVELNHFPVF